MRNPTKKINKKPLSIISQGRIHAKRELPDDLIRFSFRYFDDTNNKFGFHLAEEGYFNALIDRLRDVSGYKVSEFQSCKSNSLRAHTHDWEKTTEKNGFKCLNQQLQDCLGWQFQISVNQHGRVHGLLMDEVFYVIWLDPKHNLYS